jgi:hypothetical protein
MKATIETITPGMAADILRGNTRNRTLRKGLVELYAGEMKAGRWLETHQGIAINCDGTLLDGQHRLAAIVESGVSQRMVVTRGVPSASQIAMDDHAKRTAADSIGLDRGIHVDATTVAIARGVVRYSKNDNTQISKQEVASIMDVLRSPMEFVAPFIATKQRGVTASCVWCAVALAWFYVRDVGRLAEFCRILTGQEMAESDSDKAAVMLREWLLRTGAPSNVQHEAFRKTQRAIVAFMDRSPIGKLYGTAVHFPWPLVDPLR